MILFIIISVLVIAIIVLVIRYIKINANVLSHKSFNREARRKAKEWKKNDPMISCDYCGAKIDTKKYKTCPACGAPYDMDEEWLNRNTPDQQFVDENAEETYDEKMKEAKLKTESIAKRLKIYIIILSSILAFIIIIAICLLFEEERHDYAKDEELNTSYTKFIEAYYDIIGDGVVIDNDYVKITLKNVFVNESIVLKNTKVEFVVENKLDEDIRLSFELAGVNGLARCFDYYYEWLKAEESYTQYLSFYNTADVGDLKELVFTNFTIHTDDYSERLITENFVRIQADGKSDYRPSLAEEAKVEFENEFVTVASYYSDEDRVEYLCILNKSDNDYLVSSSGMGILNDEPVNIIGIYDEYLPAGYVANDLRMTAYRENRYKEDSTEGLQVSISFKCEKDPSKGFSTGYFTLE